VRSAPEPSIECLFRDNLSGTDAVEGLKSQGTGKSGIGQSSMLDTI
jgi:hypothetical protein